MTKYLRSISFAATVAFAFAGAQASAAVGAGTPATGRAEIVKALTLTAQSNLDLGKIVVWGNGTITLDTAGGIVCTAGALTCDATGSPATYKVTGSNNQTVTITKPDVHSQPSDGRHGARADIEAHGRWYGSAAELGGDRNHLLARRTDEHSRVGQGRCLLRQPQRDRSILIDHVLACSSRAEGPPAMAALFHCSQTTRVDRDLTITGDKPRGACV